MQVSDFFSKFSYFMDVFAWSVPFVIEKILQMLYGIIKPKGKVFIGFDKLSKIRLQELEIEVSNSAEIDSETIRKIIASIRELREKNEEIITGEVFYDQKEEPSNSKIETKPRLEDDNDLFIKAITKDRINEIRPQ